MGVKRIMETFFAGMQDQSMSGFGGRIVNTPMGPFRWNDTMQLWENVNNGMVMNNISFQDSMMLMDYASYDGGSAPITSVTPFTPGNTSYILYVNFAGSTLGSQFSFLRSSPATYFDTNGYVLGATGNAARYNTYPVFPQGLVVEKSERNYLRYTETFDVSVIDPYARWSVVNSTRNVDAAATNPDNTTGTVYITCPSSQFVSGVRSIMVSDGITANDYFSFSAWVKARTSTSASLYVLGSNAPAFSIQIPIPCNVKILSGPGTVINSAGGETHWKGVTGLSTTEWTRIQWNPYYRLMDSYTSPGYNGVTLEAVAANIYIGFYDGLGQRGVNTGDSIYIWGAQFERNPYTTTYIDAPGPNFATRETDNVYQQTGLSTWFSGASGTFALEFTVPSDMSGNTLDSQILMATSTLSRRKLFLGFTSSSQNIIFGSETRTVNVPGMTYTNKLAFSYIRGSNAGITASLNGGLTFFRIGNITNLGTGVTGDWLTLGCCAGESSLFPGEIDTSSFRNHMNGTIKSLKYWNRVLSSEDLQAETD